MLRCIRNALTPPLWPKLPERILDGAIHHRVWRLLNHLSDAAVQLIPTERFVVAAKKLLNERINHIVLLPTLYGPSPRNDCASVLLGVRAHPALKAQDACGEPDNPEDEARDDITDVMPLKVHTGVPHEPGYCDRHQQAGQRNPPIPH